MISRIPWTPSATSSTVTRMESALDIKQLRAFIALVEQGSVTAGATSLGLAQSTVSEALSSLERALGTAVFLRRRGAHELLLTDAGEALVPHARAILAMLDAAHVAVAGATSGARGSVAIATNESISTYVLSPALDAIRSAWPNTRFEVSVMMCMGVRSGVDAGDYDLGLMLQPADDEANTVHTDRIIISADVPLAVFAQPSHPLVTSMRSAAIRRDALSAFPLYLSDAAGDFHQLVRRFLEEDGTPSPNLRSTGSVESVKRGVLGDVRALGMLPAYALIEEIAARRVLALDVRPGPPRMRLDALMSKTRPQHPATRQLLDAVRNSYPSLTLA
ncbi:MAG: LysR family transcriptional regulator [bacterium]